MAFVSSQASKLQVEISAVLTDIPQLTGFKPPGINRQYKEITTLDASGNFKQYKATMNDTSEATFQGFWDPDNAVHDYLIDSSIAASAADENWKCIWSNGGAAAMTFAGSISKFEPDTQANDVLQFSGAIRVTGAPSYTQ